MTHSAPQCDRDRLRKLLDDSLAEPLAREAAEHVAGCDACRETLETLAAEPQWWSRACRDLRAILADPQAYQPSDSSLVSESASSSAIAPLAAVGASRELADAAGSAGSDDGFATDFAVDFLDPSHQPGMLGRLGEYEISEVIGRGGMGIVLKGYQPELNRYVAVKVLAPHLAASGAARKRFAREAQATAAIVHPHVMAIHAVAAQAKLPYLVMPYIPCESLQQRLDRQGPLDVRDILRIGLQAALGLSAAHAQGLVHRDVKPANILLETSVERVMLTDFGLARAVDDATLTRTGVIAGTPQYMSPEQANGDAIDHRSDLFSLGSVLYAMCAARPPFRAETTFGVLRRIREERPRPLREVNADIPEWLERIVFQLLAKQPDERPSDAMSVSVLLEQCLAHVQQPSAIPLPSAVGRLPAVNSSPSAADGDRFGDSEKGTSSFWAKPYRTISRWFASRRDLRGAAGHAMDLASGFTIGRRTLLAGAAAVAFAGVLLIAFWSGGVRFPGRPTQRGAISRSGDSSAVEKGSPGGPTFTADPKTSRSAAALQHGSPGEPVPAAADHLGWSAVEPELNAATKQMELLEQDAARDANEMNPPQK